jgi:hypothetical protein
MACDGGANGVAENSNVNKVSIKLPLTKRENRERRIGDWMAIPSHSGRAVCRMGRPEITGLPASA